MKKWYHSKTLWVNLLALIGILLARYTGTTLSADETTALLAIVNLLLRRVTNTGLY